MRRQWLLVAVLDPRGDLDETVLLHVR